MGRRSWRAPAGKMGRGLRAPGFFIRLGPITNFREELNGMVGRLREETSPVGGLPVPIIALDTNDNVQGEDHVQVMEGQELARTDPPRSLSWQTSAAA